MILTNQKSTFYFYLNDKISNHKFLGEVNQSDIANVCKLSKSIYIDQTFYSFIVYSTEAKPEKTSNKRLLILILFWYILV